MSKLILVGSVPLQTTQEVFERFGRPLGAHLDMLPDGEVGPRRYWVSGVHYRVFAIHPDLEVVRRPRRDNGVERLPFPVHSHLQCPGRLGRGHYSYFTRLYLLH